MFDIDTTLHIPIEKRRKIKDMAHEEQPATRFDQVGPRAMSTAEVLALVIGGEHALDTANDLLLSTDGIRGLFLLTLRELCTMPGIGEALARRIMAAMDLGRRASHSRGPKRYKITTPNDAAALLMPDMKMLEQEHLVVILLNSRNEILSYPTLYVGSLNTSVIRVSELFRLAIRANAAAIIIAHNHPTGDPSPSPEDIQVTRQCVKAGKLLDIDVLDHVIIGDGRFVSLKERGLGFD